MTNKDSNRKKTAKIIIATLFTNDDVDINAQFIKKISFR